MSKITIYKDDCDGSTIVSNKFIDEYMVEANDAQIKIYLYLLRMISANLPTSISDIADKFNHTEKDVLRALKYWEKCRLLSLEFNEQKEVTGIRFTTPSSNASPAEVRALAPIVPIKLVQEAPASVPASVTEASVKDYSVMPSYSRDQLKSFKESPETSQILFIAETYLQRTLSLSDIEALYFIHSELGFTCELIDYILQYCIERDKKNFSYIRKVAINLAEAGITTPKQARSYFANSYDKNIYTVMKALGRNGNPTPKEAELVSKWYKTYAFNMDVILEACGRTVVAVDSHRLEYCEKILSAWCKAGVKNLNDVSALDAAFKRPKTENGPQSSPKPAAKNSFNTLLSNDYDFAAIEKMLGN